MVAELKDKTTIFINKTPILKIWQRKNYYAPHARATSQTQKALPCLIAQAAASSRLSGVFTAAI